MRHPTMVVFLLGPVGTLSGGWFISECDLGGYRESKDPHRIIAGGRDFFTECPNALLGAGCM